MSLVKRSAPAAPGNNRPAPAASRTGAAGGGFKFQYHQRTAEDVKDKARQTSGRDSYIASEVQFFTAEQGANSIRMLPLPPELAKEHRHWGVRVFEHRDIGVDKGAYLCLNKMKGEPCPVCEERDRASGAGEKELAWTLRPGCKTLIWVINRKDEGKGPLLWNISAGGKKSLDTNLLNLCQDPGSGEVLFVDHPDEGHDLSFSRDGTGLKTSYTGYRFSHRPSPVSDIPERYEKWLRFVGEHPLDGILVWHDYDYIAHALAGQPAPTEQQQQNEEREQQPVQQAQQEQRPPLQRRGATPAPAPAAQTAAGTSDAAGDDKPSWDDLKGMDEDALIGVIGLFTLNPDSKADGFSAKGEDGNDELREWIAGQLQIEIPKPAPVATGGSWKDRLKTMTGAPQ